jgi:NAD(P)H dehydrogenase (quinone)
VRRADFEDPVSLVEAFQGVDRLLLVSTDAIDVPGRRLQQHRNAVRAAEQAGVKHVVYTSLVNPGPDSPISIAADHRGTEEALSESNLGWTVLRENIYMDLFLMSIPQALKLGGLFNAIGDGKAAYITREDCARAAAAALTPSYDGRRVLDISGPEAVSQYDVAAIASQATGQQIAYVPLELETLIQNMVSAGLPRPVAEGYASFDAGVAQDKFSAVTSTVDELTGRKPIGLADFLAAHRDILIPVAS